MARRADEQLYKNESRLVPVVRSRYLAPLPPLRSEGRARRIFVRSIIGLALAAIVGTLLAIVAWQLLPERGAGYPLYWLHDALYLPVKGRTYTAFFPLSVVWWFLIALSLTLGTISWLSDRSLIRSPHIRWLNWLVGREGNERWLIPAALALRPFGIQPVLLRSVIQQRIDLLMAALAEVAIAPVQTNGRPTACFHLTRSLARYVDMALRLEPLPLRGSPTVAQFEAINLWQRAFMHAALRGHESAVTAFVKSLTEGIFGNSAAALDSVHRATRAPLLSADALLADLVLLAQVSAPDHAALQGDANPMATLRLRARARLELLQSKAALLNAPVPVSSFLAPDKNAQPARADETLSQLGALAFALLIHVAWLDNNPNLALAALDAADVLALAPALAMASHPHDTVWAAALTACGPDPLVRALGAQLAQNASGRRWSEWRALPPGFTGLLNDDDRALERLLSNDLFAAAGPGYLPAGNHSSVALLPSPTNEIEL